MPSRQLPRHRGDSRKHSRKAGRGAQAAELAPLPTNEGVLFELWLQGRDQRARAALVERFLPLARSLARRYANTAEPLEDLNQVAGLGLVKAIDRFDPARGKPFGAFAVPTILGELRRHFRDASWSVHVARGSQERAMAVSRAIEVLQGEAGHAPAVHELAQYLEMDQEQVLDALQVIQARGASSLDAPPEDDPELSSRLERLGDPDDGYARVEDQSTLVQALEGLDEREREVLAMSFIGEMTQAEIGAHVGVSQMQVSRVMRRALERARDRAAAAG